MKTIVIFSISFILFCSCANAQQSFPFVEEAKSWSEISIYQEMYYPFAKHIWTTTYKMEGDTLYNGKIYKNLLKCDADPSVSQWYPNGWGYREEAGKVYRIEYLFSDSESIMYDFNLNVGDTVYYDPEYDDMYCIVIEVDSVLIDGSYRKRIHFNNPDDIWVEGIGSMRRPFDPINYYFIMPNIYELLCVHNDSGNIYSNPGYSQCYVNTVITGQQDLDAEHQITISNNPMHDFSVINISTSVQGVTKYSLLNAYGAMVRSGTIDNHLFILYRENLNSGIYILKVFGDGVSMKKRIIVD